MPKGTGSTQSPYTDAMTEPTQALPEGVESETLVMHDADGYPTDDRDKAVEAEIVTKYKDGREEHTLLTPQRP